MTGHWFWQFLFPILCFFVILYLFKMVSVASILSVLAAVISSYALKCDLSISLSLTALWLLVTYRHRSNLQRVMNGTESKIKWMG